MTISADELAFLRRPHVARAWFAELHLPSGISRVHPGVGNFIIDGHEWRGVSDPMAHGGGQLVYINAVEDPRFGQAVSVEIVISGANRDFIRYIHENAGSIEGVAANLYWAAFDADSGTAPFGMHKPFPGLLSAPAIQWEGSGVRTVGFTIESVWLSQDDPYGGTWSYTGQLKRFPDDEGGEFIGIKVNETIDL